MKNITKIIAVAVVAFAVSQSARALPVITGQLGLSGSSINLDGSSVSSSTEVLSWGSVTGSGNTGTFTGMSGAVTMGAVPWLFTSPETSFWTFGAFTFNLTTSIPAAPQAIGGGLYSQSIFMAGTVSATGYATTSFTGSFSIQDPGAASGPGYSFAGSFNFNSVPDGGTTALLLGSALSGLALIRRKFMA